MQKFKSKWFRIGVEGTTSDKRTIERDWLTQAAKNFNRELYGARVWLEHIRGIYADSDFRAFGDVLALKAEEVDIGGQKKMALFAQIDPTEDLVAFNKKRQKIYTSMEIDPSFGDTGEAYLRGLAVTDSPASLGTEVLSFAAEKPDASPFKNRHQSETSMFSEGIEAALEFDLVEPEAPVVTLLSRVTELLGLGKTKQVSDDARFADVNAAVQQIAEFSESSSAQIVLLAAAHAELSATITELTARATDIEQKQAEFSAQLDSTPGMPPRPRADGGNISVTDC